MSATSTAGRSPSTCSRSSLSPALAFSPSRCLKRVLAKTARSSFIGFVVLGYAVYWAAQGKAAVVRNKPLFLWQKFPKFILGFVAISVLATLGFFTAPQLKSLANLSQWAFLPAFAGVGLRTQFRDLVSQGWRPILVGVLGEIFIALLTLGMVFAVYHRAGK